MGITEVAPTQYKHHFGFIDRKTGGFFYRAVTAPTLMEAEDNLRLTLDAFDATYQIVNHIVGEIDKVIAHETLRKRYSGRWVIGEQVHYYHPDEDYRGLWNVASVNRKTVYIQRSEGLPMPVEHEYLYSVDQGFIPRETNSTSTLGESVADVKVTNVTQEQKAHKAQVDRLSMVIEKQQDTINALLGIL